MTDQKRGERQQPERDAFTQKLYDDVSLETPQGRHAANVYWKLTRQLEALKSDRPPSADFEVDVDASREANAILDHLAEKFGESWSTGLRMRALEPRFDIIQATWDSPTEANPEGVFELHEAPTSGAAYAFMVEAYKSERERLREAVIAAAIAYREAARIAAPFRKLGYSKEHKEALTVCAARRDQLYAAVDDMQAAQEAKPCTT